MSNDGDELSRRAFVTRGLAFGAALGGLPAADMLLGGARSGEGNTTSQGAEDFRALFGLRYPLVQAALAGAGGPELAIAVADAGALGSLALTRESPEAAERLVRAAGAKLGVQVTGAGSASGP